MNEEKMNIDIENQEKKKKITIICLSAALVFITLIAGLFLIKKNKESRYENNDLEEVVDEDHEDHKNNNDNNHENDDVIVNEGDYFFNKTSGQVTTNVLLSIVTGILFFFWENDKLSDKNDDRELCSDLNKHFLLCGGFYDVYCGSEAITDDADVGIGIFEKANWFGFASLGFLIGITFLVELILHFLLGSISYFFSKDKNKKYLHTLKMFWKKRKQIFFSFSKTKTFFVTLGYLICGFVIAILARTTGKKLKPCCEYWSDGGEIIFNHNINYCLCYYKVKYEYKSELSPPKENNTGQKNQEVEMIGARRKTMELIKDMRSFRMDSFHDNQN